MKKIIRRSCVAVAIICSILLATVGIIKKESKPYIYQDKDLIPHTDTALIPGASVSLDGVMSPVLKDRANAAIVLYNNQKVNTILISGDNSTTTYNEVSPVKLYLIAYGIPEENIYLDYAGFDTYSTMYRARDIFLVKNMTVVTQSFHLPRAVYLARHLGITAYGYDANDGHYLLKNYIREWFADVKAMINLLVNTKPKYLGKIVPVSS